MTKKKKLLGKKKYEDYKFSTLKATPEQMIQLVRLGVPERLVFGMNRASANNEILRLLNKQSTNKNGDLI